MLLDFRSSTRSLSIHDEVQNPHGYQTLQPDLEPLADQAPAIQRPSPYSLITGTSLCFGAGECAVPSASVTLFLPLLPLHLAEYWIFFGLLQGDFLNL